MSSSFNLMSAQARKERLQDPEIQRIHKQTDRDVMVEHLTKCSERAGITLAHVKAAEDELAERVRLHNMAATAKSAAKAKLALFDMKEGFRNG